jgi:hypothetical protein
MTPTSTIRCDVVSAAREPNVYDISCRLGEEPTEAEISAAVGALRDRLAVEMASRKDAPSSEPTLVQWRPAKMWILHLYAVGQWPAQESAQ